MDKRRLRWPVQYLVVWLGVFGLPLNVSAISLIESRAAFEAEKAARLYALYSFVDSVGLRVGSKLRNRKAPDMGVTPSNIVSGLPIGSIPGFQGLPTLDSNGRALGYCAWDIDASADVLSGADVIQYAGANGNARQLVYAVVSAGPNGVIQTGCDVILSRYNDINLPALATGDDVVFADVSPLVASNLFRSSIPTVAALGAIASPEQGEIRFVNDTNRFYSYDSISGWTAVSAYGSFVEDSPTELSFVGSVSVSDLIANNSVTVSGNTNITGNLVVNTGTISGDGSGLTSLNANNITSGTLAVARGGTGVDGSAAANGSLLIGNGSGYTLGSLTAGAGVSVLNGSGTIEIQNSGVLSITGSPDQVITSASTGNVTLSLPQAIATTSTPTFAGMTLNGALSGTSGLFSGALSASRLDVSAGGVTTPNVIVGTGAMPLVQSGAGANTVLGYQALVSNTSGAFNLALGARSDVGSAALNYASTVGAYSQVSTSNTIVLGALGVNKDGVVSSVDDQVVIGSASRNDTYANTRFFLSGAGYVDGDLYVSGGITSSGANLTNLNADNVSTGTLAVARGGTGLDGSAAANGSLLIGNGSGYTLGTLTAGTGIGVTNGAGTITISNTGVTSLAGTANQVIVSSGTGAVTLSLPQNIATTSAPTFAGMTLTGTLSAVAANFTGAVNVASELYVSGQAIVPVNKTNIDSALTFADDNPTFDYGDNLGLGVNALSGGSVSTGNLAIGANVLANLDSSTGNAYRNTGLGNQALSSNTTGNDNTATGEAALFSNTTGSFNTASGQASLYSNTSGQWNSAFGQAALFANTTGSRNTALGQYSLGSNTTGSLNTAVGYRADVLSGALNYGSAFGAHSYVSTSDTLVLGALGSDKNATYSTTDDQVVIGATARNDTYANTKLFVSGSTNIAGTLYADSINIASALSAPRLDIQTSTGVTNPNLIIGVGAMSLAQSGTGGNTAIGPLALSSNTSGSGNLAVGSSALRNTTAGANNTAVGNQALNANTVGNENTALGNTALFQNIDGTGNTAVGRDALRNSTTGTRNTSLGSYALDANTTGSLNTAVGYRADVLSGALNYGSAFGAHAYVSTSDTLVLGALGSDKNATYSTTDDQVVIGDNVRTGTHKLYVDGTALITGGVTTSSDLRLKKDLSILDVDLMLSKLSQINVYKYSYISKLGLGKKVGVVAQELESLFPEVANYGNGDQYLSVDYSALGAMAAVGVGKLHTRLSFVEGQQAEHIQRLDEHQNRIESLEQWREATKSTLGDMQAAIDTNLVRITEHAARIATNEENIVRLEEVLVDLQTQADANTDEIGQIKERWQSAFGVDAANSVITINYDELRVSNLSAREVLANSVYAERLEAEIARIKQLEVDELQAKKVTTGTKQIYVPSGAAVTLFSTESDGHYTVTTSASDGSYATATLVVSGGVAKVIPSASGGIEIVSFGSAIQLKSSGKLVKASWLKTG